MNQEKIEEGLTQFPICEYAFINIADITFLDQVRYICKTECPQYGKSCLSASGRNGGRMQETVQPVYGWFYFYDHCRGQ